MQQIKNFTINFKTIGLSDNSIILDAVTIHTTMKRRAHHILITCSDFRAHFFEPSLFDQLSCLHN